MATLDIEDIVSKDTLACAISDQFIEWNTLRSSWLTKKQELRNYIFATDTTTTTNASLPWRNTTVTPKLCQIRDNLHANYMASLFPNSNWLNWEGYNDEAVTKEKRKAIEQYILNKTRLAKFSDEVSRLVYDYIDYGNVFATVEYVREEVKGVDGSTTQGYVGPRAVRISPYDIVFNPKAKSFRESPKIIRQLMTIGELRKTIKTQPDAMYLTEAVDALVQERRDIQNVFNTGDSLKGNGYHADGFTDWQTYLTGNYVEVLTFYGDFYDIDKDELLENHIIVVVDGTKLVRKEPNPSWLGKDSIQHVGWRHRPDNLYSMGPLDNLVGMQYRIDHLENIKADVFDLVAFPVKKIRGDVEYFEYGPGEDVVVGDDGDVEFMSPDAQALQADFHINVLEQKMEEMAGAPKNAMGIRTPGEKTAFEVQQLDNASSRIFQDKITNFEEMFLEPILNDMLEVARRNLDGQDLVRVFDEQEKIASFLSITKEDISADGRLIPVGARHFAEQALMIQNLNGFFNSAMGQDPAVNVHFSGAKLALMLEENLNLEPYQIVSPNARLFEMAESQRLSNSLQEQVAVEQATPSGLTEDDVDEEL